MAKNKPSYRKYKALIIDLDGTTVPFGMENLPTNRVIAAVSSLVKRGIPVSVASGRMVSQAEKIVEMLGLQDPCMFSNGAIIYDPKTKKVIESVTIDDDSLAKILEVTAEDKDKLVIHSPYEERTYTAAGFGELVTAVFIDKLTEEKALEYVEDLSHIPTITAHHSNVSFDLKDWFVAINEVRATKQRALQHLLNRLQIQAEDIVAVGDGENDLPMVIAAGMGVAMGNAAEGLKSVADFIAPSVTEDGLAYVIEKFFPEV